MAIEETKGTVQVRSGSSGKCAHCDEMLPGAFDEIHKRINHYLEHGYKLLHIGTEGGSAADDPNSHFETVAILGH